MSDGYIPQQVPANAPRRYVPGSDLDFNLMVTDPDWSRQNLSIELKKKMQDIPGGLTEPNSRDLRLGNIDKQKLEYCAYYMDFANDIIKENMIRAFAISSSRAADVLDLSQSVKGFLRKMHNTLRNEATMETLEPAKKSMWSGKAKEGY